jgi:hypothetical protein
LIALGPEKGDDPRDSVSGQLLLDSRDAMIRCLELVSIEEKAIEVFRGRFSWNSTPEGGSHLEFPVNSSN